MHYKKSEAKAWAKENLKGHWTTMVTPFTQRDEVDAAGLRKNIDYVVSLGTKGMGFTWLGGEFWSLTMAERKQVCEVAVNAAKGRSMVGIHTAHTSVKECVELTKHAEEAGADLAILSPPYIVAKTDEQVYRFFEKVAEQVNIGIAIFNTPHMGMVLSAAGVAKLVNIPNVCAIKEASVNYPLSVEVHRLVGDKIVVSTPFEEIFFYEPVFNFHQQVLFANPQDWMFDTPGRNYFVQFINLATQGRLEEASRIYRGKNLLELRKIYDRHWKYILSKHNGAFGTQFFKAWAEIVGLAAGHVRPPLVPMKEEEIEALRNDLIRVGRIGKEAIPLQVKP